MRSWLRLVACLALCFAVSFLGSRATLPEIPTWYAALNKPFWTPPPFVFPIVWTTLYVLMAVALWRLWEKVPPSFERRRAIGLFLLQLALNAIWSPVFFTLHRTGWALAILVALIVALGATVMAARRVDRIAAWLLAPYFVWVCYAFTLNAGVVWLNR